MQSNFLVQSFIATSKKKKKTMDASPCIQMCGQYEQMSNRMTFSKPSSTGSKDMKVIRILWEGADLFVQTPIMICSFVTRNSRNSNTSFKIHLQADDEEEEECAFRHFLTTLDSRVVAHCAVEKDVHFVPSLRENNVLPLFGVKLPFSSEDEFSNCSIFNEQGCQLSLTELNVFQQIPRQSMLQAIVHCKCVWINESSSKFGILYELVQAVVFPSLMSRFLFASRNDEETIMSTT